MKERIQGVKERVQYVLVPHPDDEFSGWSLVQDRAFSRSQTFWRRF